MPKPKPDQVIRHEIVLGRSERELVEGALVAYQVNRIATPTVALLSDVSAMSIILTALATYLGFQYNMDAVAVEGTQALINDWQNQYTAYKESPTYQAAVAAAQIPFLPIGGIGEGSPIQRLLAQLFG
jgi:hypothetical protein